MAKDLLLYYGQAKPLLFTGDMNIENQDLLKLAARAVYYHRIQLIRGGKEMLREAIESKTKFIKKAVEAENAASLQHGLLYFEM